uniref:Orf81 n=1 Tax=Moineauvirus Sfi21 TaxID=64186 RepID=O21868_9CAUD|nr:orf81 [Streptococcus phage Sfi21]
MFVKEFLQPLFLFWSCLFVIFIFDKRNNFNAIIFIDPIVFSNLFKMYRNSVALHIYNCCRFRKIFDVITNIFIRFVFLINL